MKRVARAGRYEADGVEPLYLEHLRTRDFSLGTYSIPSGGQDPQQPHSEDELYIVTHGAGLLWTPGGIERVAPGDVLFVPAGEPHRFTDVSDDLCVIVMFAPPEHSRRGLPRRPQEDSR